MKRMILVPLMMMVGCGTGAFDPGAQRTTAAEARQICESFIADSPDGEAFFNAFFVAAREDRGNGFTEATRLTVSLEFCLEIDIPGCFACLSAIINAVYDE